MNPLTLEWLEKAEGDFFTAKREIRVRKNPNYDAVCFHAQQAAEKYLKAVLQEKGETIPRIHSLLDLIALIAKSVPEFIFLSADANILEGYAVQFRYPGFSANKDDAVHGLRVCENIRKFVKANLNISV